MDEENLEQVDQVEIDNYNQEDGGSENFKVVKGKFKYGKYDDEVGMFMVILGNDEVKSWNLIMTDDPESQLTPIDGDYIIFKRIFDGNTIKDKKRSYNFKQQLKEELDDSAPKLIRAAEEEVENFFDRHLHLLAKEEVDLSLATEEIREEKVRKDFPQLFIAPPSEEETREEEKTVLDCSISIAPIDGKRLVNIKIGDKLILKFPGLESQEGLQEELAEVRDEKDKLIGKVEEVDYDEEEDIYIFLASFTPQIFGRAT
ncbi:MAG: hypothetical protein R6V17_08150, partial [Halanaerobacter sp.]